MNELMKTEVQTMSSLEIAELTGKRHDNLMVDIEKMLTELEIDVLKFQDIYKDTRNREQQCFKLPRREAEIDVSNFGQLVNMLALARRNNYQQLGD